MNRRWDPILPVLDVNAPHSPRTRTHLHSVKVFLHDVGFDASALQANYHEFVSLVQERCGFPVGAPAGDEATE